jgi:hypothetical protein
VIVIVHHIGQFLAKPQNKDSGTGELFDVTERMLKERVFYSSDPLRLLLL